MARRLQFAGIVAVVLIIALAVALRARDVQVFADGNTTAISSRSSNQVALVEGAGVILQPGDVVESTAGGDIAVRRARQATLTVDGQAVAVRTQAETIAELLLDARVSLGALDSVRLDGTLVPTNATLSAEATSAVEVRRAVPITIVENGHAIRAQSSLDTIAAALDQLDVRLGPGDIVRPPLSSELSAGIQVQVDHARQLTVTLPGGKAVLYTHEEAVGPAVTLGAIGLPIEYRLEPAEDTPISAGLAVRVVGISRDEEMETVRIESQTFYEPDPSLPAGTTFTTSGQDGVLHREFATAFEDDILVSRSLSAEWYDPIPIDTVVYYSTAVSPATPTSSAAWAGLVCSYSWDCDWALAVIQCESAGNPSAYNSAGYVGLFQIWEGHGSNLEDPATNVAAAYSLFLSGGRSPWPNCP
jgi:uncharacterized protein YabE (DUF348 family)